MSACGLWLCGAYADAMAMRMPDDMSVISYGGSLITSNSQPEMASVVLPMAAIGRTIPELIRRRLADPNALPVSMQLETEFLDGKSLGASRR